MTQATETSPSTQGDMEKYAREMSVMLVRLLGGGSEWFKLIGDEYYVCPKLAGEELQRRKIEAIVTKKALFRVKGADIKKLGARA